MPTFEVTLQYEDIGPVVVVPSDCDDESAWLEALTAYALTLPPAPASLEANRDARAMSGE